MKLTHYGKKEIFILNCLGLMATAGAMTLAFLVDLTAGVIIASFVIVLWFSLLAFFRDPSRKIPTDPCLLLSPADGVVYDIELIAHSPENEYFEGANAIRVGIFLSVLDVHINRAPCEMEVVEKFARQGKYHDARNPLASSENNAMTLVGKAKFPDMSFLVLVRQITGAIAKRIVCDVEPGSRLDKGQSYGMIKFGSRTELFFPARLEIETSVKVGDRVYAGTSVIAKVKGAK